MRNFNKIFDKLWQIYTSQNPYVKKVADEFFDLGEHVVNDHIAFRTFEDERVNIDVIAKPFIEAGYVLKNEYLFDEKKLFAKHYEHQTDELAPRVFISELQTQRFSAFMQKTIKDLLDSVDQKKFKSDQLIYSGRLWGQPSYETYEILRLESEYAAWLYVNGFVANHFTVSVNHLKKLTTLEQVNDFLKKKGFVLNDSGGEIKGNPSELLEQSSIRAELMPFEFSDGIYEIPGCYYEFARRYNDVNGNLYSGFIAKSADKIFESTDFKIK